MFTLNLIFLICFINICGYIVSLYLISKYEIESKYHKFKRSIRYYDKSTQFFIIIVSFIGLIFLLIIIKILILYGLIYFK